MKIMRVSPMSGVHTYDLPICQAQITALVNGRPIELAFANLEDWQRLFYESGYTREDTRRMFGLPVFDPGDRVVFADRAGFVLSMSAQGVPPTYAVKFDDTEEPVEGFPQDDLKRE
jgi:hypothetical protein